MAFLQRVTQNEDEVITQVVVFIEYTYTYIPHIYRYFK